MQLNLSKSLHQSFPYSLTRPFSNAIRKQIHDQTKETVVQQGDIILNKEPSGSALFQECKHFIPIVKPDPCFQNPTKILESLQARNLVHKFDLNHLVDLKKRADGIQSKLDNLENRRKQIASLFKSDKVVKDEATSLKSSRKKMRDDLDNLMHEYQPKAIQLPNVLHHLTPTNDIYTVRSLPKETRSIDDVQWAHKADNVNNTLLGQYLTGDLAHWEQSGLMYARHFWLELSQSVKSTYLITLSDIVRGTVMEASAWPSNDQVIRLKANQNDLLHVPNDVASLSSSVDYLSSSSLSLNPSEWYINPHTTEYLSGSASLAAFSDANSTPDQSIGYRQEKALSLIELNNDLNQCELGFHDMTDQLIQFWQSYQPNWSLRLVYLPAPELYPCEMLRAVIQAVPDKSNITESGDPIINLAFVSMLGDWISRRICSKCLTPDHLGLETYLYTTYAQVWNYSRVLDAFQKFGHMTRA